LHSILKWKLSSITPIVVRRTIQNSGFKLVRSEHCLVQNATDLSVISEQTNQNTISLQNHYGVTPPIIDAFCGVVPSPNELMMLPLLPESRECICTFLHFFLYYTKLIIIITF
jgi:hypothetical protein